MFIFEVCIFCTQIILNWMDAAREWLAHVVAGQLTLAWRFCRRSGCSGPAVSGSRSRGPRLWGCGGGGGAGGDCAGRSGCAA